jgi:threonine dehydratase
VIQTVRTPLIPLHSEENRQSGKIFLKPENLQPFGSYKIRGVASVLRMAKTEELKHGLCAASAGNMAQAVAFAAQRSGIGCRIYIPDSAPEVKKSAIRKLGAVLVERPFHEIWKIVNGEIKVDEPGLFIHPAFNDRLLLGYGSIADELIADLPDIDAVVIPFGVGGLALGIAKRMSELRPSISIYLVEPETAAPFKQSLKRGAASKIERMPSFVDAIGTPEVLPQVFKRLTPSVTDSIVVTLAEIKETLRALYFNHKLICEGAGAASLAAATKLSHSSSHNKIACILSGGNIDKKILDEVTAEGQSP